MGEEEGDGVRRQFDDRRICRQMSRVLPRWDRPRFPRPKSPSPTSTSTSTSPRSNLTTVPFGNHFPPSTCKPIAKSSLTRCYEPSTTADARRAHIFSDIPDCLGSTQAWRRSSGTPFTSAEIQMKVADETHADHDERQDLRRVAGDVAGLRAQQDGRAEEGCMPTWTGDQMEWYKHNWEYSVPCSEEVEHQRAGSCYALRVEALKAPEG